MDEYVVPVVAFNKGKVYRITVTKLCKELNIEPHDEVCVTLTKHRPGSLRDLE
jgi:hypothetical protein